MNKEIDLNDLFSKAKELKSDISSVEAIGRFTEHVGIASTSSLATTTHFFTKKFIIMIITTLTLVIAGVLISIPSTPSKSLEPAKEVTPTQIHRVKEDGFKPINEQSVPVALRPVPSMKESVSTLSLKELNPLFDFDLDIVDMKRIRKVVSTSTPLLRDQKYYPKLTPDEIKANEKQKKKMVKSLAKFDDKFYTFVPSGSFELNGQVTSVQSFHMGVNEVTNLEFRTFLFDLLINDRKAEFDLARPLQENWTTYLSDSSKAMELTYFSDHAFDDYPVVNVTQQGAEVYCKWLTQELVKSNGSQYNDLRVPVKDEWILAASSGGKFMSYPWGDAISNEKGCFLANFDGKVNGEGLMAGDGALLTAKTETYNPTERGLYNISGNVAELAYDSRRDENGVYIRESTMVECGGGWNDSSDALKVDGPKKAFEEASPNVGFRVVMTYVKMKL